MDSHSPAKIFASSSLERDSGTKAVDIAPEYLDKMKLLTESWAILTMQESRLKELKAEGIVSRQDLVN